MYTHKHIQNIWSHNKKHSGSGVSNVEVQTSTLKCWLLCGLMRKQDTKQSIMRSKSVFWLPVPRQKGLAGLNSNAWQKEGKKRTNRPVNN